MNYSHLESKHNDALLSLEEMRQMGVTHASYCWSKRIQNNWSADQLAAYVQGYDNHRQLMKEEANAKLDN